MKTTQRKEFFETPVMTVLYADGAEVMTSVITTSSLGYDYGTGDYDIDF